MEDSFRLGKNDGEKKRPIKIVFNNKDTAFTVL